LPFGHPSEPFSPESAKARASRNALRSSRARKLVDVALKFIDAAIARRGDVLRRGDILRRGVA
jgi:hypothetical protein